MGEVIQFAPRQHKRDLETMTIKMARQLIQFAKEGEPILPEASGDQSLPKVPRT